MEDRRIYPETEVPMSEAERKAFRAAYDAHYKVTIRKNADSARAHRLSTLRGEAAVRRMRGPQLSAEERTLPLRFT